MNWFQVSAVCVSILLAGYWAGYSIGLAVSLHEHEMRSMADSLERIVTLLEERGESDGE